MGVARGGKTAHIDVSDVPELARPRTAAVAVAETLRWWTDLPTAPAQQPPTIVATPPGVGHDVPPAPAGSTPERYPRLSADLGLRAMVLGPERSLFWGATADAAYRPFRCLRASIGASYSTSFADSALGAVRVHALGASAALGLSFGRSLPQAFPVEARLGLGAEWLGLTAFADSVHGYDEPRAHAWALLADAHAALAVPVQRTWSLSFSMAAVKDLRGVVFHAGGEESVSIYGWGVSSEVLVERTF